MKSPLTKRSQMPQVVKSMSGNLLEKLVDRAHYTPDFTELRLFHDIILLVYDNMQKYGHQHNLLDGAKYVGKGITIPSKFVMKHGHDFPVVFEQPHEELIHAAIKGEVYLVSPQHILAIDKFQMNNSWMHRKVYKVALLDQGTNSNLTTVGQKYLKYAWSNCFMYVGDKGMFADQLLKGRHTRVNPYAGDQVLSKSHYEWDPWEADWMQNHNMGYDPDEISDDMFGGGRGVHCYP